MNVLRILLVVLILAVAGVCFGAGPPAADEAFPDPQRMFELVFGQQAEEDEKALKQIEVTPREERQMGEAAVAAYLDGLRSQGIRVVTRGKDAEYLRKLVERIHRLMKAPKRYPRITVYLVQSSRCDARSFPGGTLVFFRGLLEMARNEAALVGIVGHELSHLDRGHHLDRLRRIKLAQQTFSDGPQGFSFERFFTAGSTMMRLWSRPFRPEFEAEADRDGARWAYVAGYDPREMARLFLDLRDRRGNLQGLLPDFLRTHPAPEGRHKAIMELYEKLQREKPKARLYVGKENLRRRIPRAQREFRE